MKKILLSILMLSLIYNCDNNTIPSAEDNATFNKNVESWKDVVSGFSSRRCWISYYELISCFFTFLSK